MTDKRAVSHLELRISMYHCSEKPKQMSELF